jgi:RNA recognition motif-containing protein
MGFTVFLGNLPAWVTADDVKGWLSAENLVADAIKVIRNPETQESKGFAFIDAPNIEEMNSIIRRFDRAPLEDRLLRANPAQPPKPKTGPPVGRPPGGHAGHGGPGTGHTPNVSAPRTGQDSGQPAAAQQTAAPTADRPPRRDKREGRPRREDGPQSAFAEELAKAL